MVQVAACNPHILHGLSMPLIVCSFRPRIFLHMKGMANCYVPCTYACVHAYVTLLQALHMSACLGVPHPPRSYSDGCVR